MNLLFLEIVVEFLLPFFLLVNLFLRKFNQMYSIDSIDSRIYDFNLYITLMMTFFHKFLTLKCFYGISCHVEYIINSISIRFEKFFE